MSEPNTMCKTAVSIIMTWKSHLVKMEKIVSELSASPLRGQERPLNPHRVPSSDEDRCHGIIAMPLNVLGMKPLSWEELLVEKREDKNACGK